ncbi:MAG TPA: TIM barrel protein [Terracidiphilus sp.]|jgi:sugar phosphate isomerase/epimerase|nr:TIM barrel protein [Terracidiphilus sp.]
MKSSSRRDFLKKTGAVAASTIVASRLGAAPLHQPIGLQLYSVRNLLPNDFDGTLHQLSEAGYREVEAAGYFSKTAAEFRHSMDQAGLRCISAHHTLLQLRTQLDELVEYAHTLGLEYLICSSSGGVHRDPAAKGELTLDDWRFVAGEFNRIGEKLKSAGITFGVHNHVPEFAVENGTVVYDELLRLTDPKFVVFEMDCGWVTAAGHNPVDYLRKTPERFPLLHVKDMTREAGGKFHSVVLGTGVVDYRPILRAATGLKHYFIEQEEFAGDPMTELRADAAYMRKLDV